MAEDTPSPSPEKSSTRVDELIDRGLELYGTGELHAAMNEWEHALSISPDAERAREYLAYVRENFALLESRFADAAEVAKVSAELDVPFGLESIGDDDFYDLVELETETDAAPAKSSIERYIESVDEGWFLDELPETGRADALPPPPAESAAELAEELEAVSAGLMDVADDAAGEVFELEADLPPDDAESYEFAAASAVPVAPAEFEPESRDARSGGDVTLDLEFEPGVGPSVDLEAAPPLAAGLDLNDIELAPAGAPGAPGTAGTPAAIDDYDDEMTVERGAASGPLPNLTDAGLPEEVTVPGGEEPLPFTDNLSLSNDALAAIRPGTADGVAVDEPTIERPGIVKRGFALGNLDELDGALRDDRVLDGDDSPEVKVAFRNKDEDLDEEEMTIERPALVDRAGGLDQRPAAVDLSGLDDEFTVDRRLNPAVIVDQSLLAEDLETIDRRLDDGITADAEFSSGQETRELRRGESPDVGSQVVADALLELEDGAPAGESEEDRIRRRISYLVKGAGGHAARGRTKIAMGFLDLALDEAPDTATAQKVIHRHRDLILEIYELFLGSMDAVPVVAVPMEELGSNELDNRAVFLLSRIDGTITLEEVLDVSGMPRLEAFRYLCRMLVKGILEIR